MRRLICQNHLKPLLGPALFSLLHLFQIALSIDDTYQSYIQSLAYSARLVVRPDSSTVALGSKVAFFCRADGNPLPPIQWSLNGKTAHNDERLSIVSKSTGLSTLRIDPVQLKDNGTVISCTADNGVGHPVFADANLIILKNDTLPDGFPQIIVHPALRTIENGKTAYVSCKVGGDPRPKVLWLRDSLPLDMRADTRYSVSTIGNPGALMIQHAKEEDQGVYECIARNIHGVAHSKQANLYVKVRRVPPYFSYKLEKLYRVASGGSINLTCVAVGYPMPRVFWRKSGQHVNLDASINAPIGKNLLTLTNVENADNFTCVAVSPLGNIEATTHVQVLPLPGAPKDVKITGITSSGLVVQWKEPKFDQPILQYVVKYRQRGVSGLSSSADSAVQRYGDSKKWIEVKTEDRKLEINGLEPFQQYEFTVATEVEVGVGEASMVIEAQTDEEKPESPPIKPQARSLSRDSLLVKWSPSERPNGVLTSYNVYYTDKSRDLDIEKWEKLTTKADDLLVTLSELEPDQKYYIKVQAVNSKGSSPLSQLVTVQTTPGLPGQPVALLAKSLDAKRIALTWEKPLFSVPVSGYVISYNTSDDVREITLTSPHEKHTITALNPDTEYSFRVAAYTSRGQGEFSEFVHEKTPSPTPVLLQNYSSTSRSLLLSWNMSAEFHVVQYRVKYREKVRKAKNEDFDVDSSEEVERNSRIKKKDPEEIARPWATVETAERTVNLTNLMPYTLYEVTVSAFMSDKFGADSKPKDFKTNEDVPSAPRHLDVQLTSPTSIKITWQPPVHANGILMGYYIYHDKMSGGNGGDSSYNKRSTTQIRDPAKTYFEMDKLEPNTEYAFRMNAFNRNGDGEFTEVRTIVTGGIPPNPPEILSLSLVREETPLAARIDWKPPAIRQNEGPINKYNIWYKPKGYSDGYVKMKTVEGTATTAQIDGLWMGLEYDIWLGAENEEGQSGNATETLLTPVGSPDGEPQAVHYEISQEKIVVSWMPPKEDQRNGNITAYKAVLTPMDATGERIEKKIEASDSGSSQRVTFAVDAKKAYTFKVAASTMKGQGPFSPVLTINPDASALVGPPTNVRVEATSDTSAVVQWDFDNGQADAFVIKYLHEPGGQSDNERWSQHSVVGHVRHFEVPNLVSGKPYAFCVLTVKNNRQGPCSDPLTVLEQVKPTYMVQKLRIAWKTSNSVMLQWEYDGPKNIAFYLNHTGKKEYLDQSMQLKQMKTPGFEHELDSGSRQYLWTTLRPHMQYTFHVGVRSQPPGSRQYWPMEVTTVTDSTGPPFVDVPIILDSSNLKVGQVQVRLSLASEEYGPISHYWLIVVPGNYSNDDVVNLEPSELEKSTQERSRSIAGQKAKQKRAIVLPNYHNSTEEKSSSSVLRFRRSARKNSGAFVTAQIPSSRMQDDYKKNQPFVIGDEKVYDGFTNYALEPNTKYRLMMRAFAKSEGKRKELDSRAPMSEKLSRLYTDSALTPSFTTKAGGKGVSGGASKHNIAYLIGPAIAILVIAFTVGMVLCWFLKCRNRRGSARGARHGSIAKVALSNNMMNSNGVYGETSKLLNGDDGRHVMNPYEQMNGGAATDSSFALYPLPTQAGLNHRSVSSTYAPLPVPVPALPHNNNTSPMSHAAIPIAELQHHIERLRMNNNLGFQQEFESIETGQHFSWENSSADVNKHKNRYANVVAYDHTRVMLSAIDGIPGSDYINANYIDGYDKPKAYIATQGPLAETFADFWRMIWEEGSATIVMLTNLEERARIKCDQYWPTRGTSTYGDIQVTLLETTILAHYTMRILRLQMIGDSEMREIRHLQYTAWPDHGVPDHPTPFLIFLKRVKSLNPPGAGPIVSHCSAGIGRTGAFIVIDIILERLRYENTVDIYGCVTSLRSQRSYMVQTEEQYIFIHDSVLDAVQSGSTEIPVAKLKQHVAILQQRTSAMDASTIELEFRHLCTLKWPNARRAIGNLPINRGKNRPNGVIPFDANRVVLSQILGVDGSDYVNASWIDGYRERGAYIATQGPLMDTYPDFWRMIWEHDSAIIVMLVKTWENGREQCVEYWPRESHGVQVGNLVLQLMNEYNMPQYVLREFKLSDVDSNMSRTVRHFQYTEWPEMGVPSNAEAYIDFIQQVHRTKSQFGIDGPIAIHCSEGAGRTGIFIALSTLIERIRAEKVVDVFTTVKLLRTERECMVTTKEEYNFLYEACIEYLNCL